MSAMIEPFLFLTEQWADNDNTKIMQTRKCHSSIVTSTLFTLFISDQLENIKRGEGEKLPEIGASRLMNCEMVSSE